MSSLLEPNPVELGRAAFRNLAGITRCLGNAKGHHDLLLVGNGQPVALTPTAGWACVACDFLHERAVVHAGILTSTTPGFAEMLPYVHALAIHQQEHRDDVPGRSYRVAVISPDQDRRSQDNGRPSWPASDCLQIAIRYFGREGYAIRWYHGSVSVFYWQGFLDAIVGRAGNAPGDLQSIIEEEVRSFNFDK